MEKQTRTDKDYLQLFIIVQQLLTANKVHKCEVEDICKKAAPIFDKIIDEIMVEDR